jgi:hypothetical protein
MQKKPTKDALEAKTKLNFMLKLKLVLIAGVIYTILISYFFSISSVRTDLYQINVFANFIIISLIIFLYPKKDDTISNNIKLALIVLAYFLFNYFTTHYFINKARQKQTSSLTNISKVSLTNIGFKNNNQKHI